MVITAVTHTLIGHQPTPYMLGRPLPNRLIETHFVNSKFDGFGTHRGLRGLRLNLIRALLGGSGSPLVIGAEQLGRLLVTWWSVVGIATSGLLFRLPLDQFNPGMDPLGAVVWRDSKIMDSH